MKKVLFIAGPTAVGKTSLSIELAKKLDGEIISADSMQLYKYLDIGSAKPTVEEMEGIKHHLLDIIDPENNFSVSEYQLLAKKAIKEVQDRGKTPIVVGGTGLYFNSLMYDMNFSDASKDEKYREKLEKLAEEHGNEYVHNMLKFVDVNSYNKIHPNNLKKVIRALEIHNTTGKSIEDFNKIEKTTDYEYELYVLTMNRRKLYGRINKRVDIMIEAGLLDEVKGLVDKNIPKNSTAMQGIGYKEVVNHLKGMYDYETMIKIIKQRSRNYAKRQMTWFKRYDDAKWLDLDKYNSDELLDIIVNNK